MAQSHVRRADLAKQNVCYIFQAGDTVLLRSREVGKLKCRATGPYLFRKYVGWRSTNAEIEGAAGRVTTVSAANLLPLHPQTHETRMTRLEWNDESEDGSSIDDPPNVHRVEVEWPAAGDWAENAPPT